MSNKPCNLNNKELINKVRDWIDDLTKSGGKKWAISSPANYNLDPDLLINELCNRFENSENSKYNSLKEKLLNDVLVLDELHSQYESDNRVWNAIFDCKLGIKKLIELLPFKPLTSNSLTEQDLKDLEDNDSNPAINRW